jgi:glycosyltransferase involved in cell wall biosynthesis
MVFGNALYIDSQDKPILVDHGAYKTSLYYGAVQERGRVPAYWSYIHSIPQPTVFFRRRLLEKCGRLDENYKFIFDFELFFRFMSTGRLKKIEKTLAFYRIHEAGKTAGWNSFLVELYRFSRPQWPALSDPDFKRTLVSFTRAFMRRAWGQRRRGLAYKVIGILVAAIAATRLGNPESSLKRLEDRRTRGSKRNTHIPPEMRGMGDATDRPPPIKRSTARYRAVFCSLFLPRYPGISGGEIRDFHLLRELQRFCDITFVSLHPTTSDSRCDPLSEGFSACYDPITLAQHFPTLAKPEELHRLRTLRARLSDRMRRSSLPVPGERLSRDPGLYLSQIKAYSIDFINSRLQEQDVDFLIVSPQTNPLGLVANRQQNKTRFILGTYDVEMVRLQRVRDGMRGIKRVGAQLEARRAAEFERSHLRAFDGVIAVSELDRSIFIRQYGIDPRRVLSLENGVDTGYFAFHRRKRGRRPIVLFTGSFGYRPNHHAAMRLVRRIMPQVWRKIPDAQLWIVGQQPDPDLGACSDGKRVFVTGRVESIRPYLQEATVYCAPLESGSGTKYKILEALSSGVPIVCTEVAREGFDLEDGKHVIVAETDGTIADRIAWLVENTREADVLAETGRAFVEQVHDWRRILFKLGPWLDGVAQLPKLSTSSDVRDLYGMTEQTLAYRSSPDVADTSDFSAVRIRSWKAHDERPSSGSSISNDAVHREAN